MKCRNSAGLGGGMQSVPCASSTYPSSDCDIPNTSLAMFGSYLALANVDATLANQTRSPRCRARSEAGQRPGLAGELGAHLVREADRPGVVPAPREPEPEAGHGVAGRVARAGLHHVDPGVPA